jgi:hypothetical protein
MPRSIAVVLLSAICVSASAHSQTRDREEDLRKLFGTAVSGLPSAEVVHRIALSGKGDTVRLLVAIAATPTAAFQNREAAIVELTRLASPEAMEGLAELLAPHQPLTIRESVARGLESSNCSERCVKSVLFYLYRLWAGEKSLREQTKNSSLAEEFGLQQAHVVSSLETLLTRQKTRTLGVLLATYGLGTEEPSPFGIDLVQRLHWRESCDLLMRSESYQQKLSVMSKTDPMKTTKAIELLDCR